MLNFSLLGGRNYVFGDVVIPLLLVIEYLQKNCLKLSQAINEFKGKYFISGEINIKDVDYKKIANKVKAKYRKHKISRLDGLSVFGPDWFINVRPSHTEPLIRLNIEAGTKSSVEKIRNELLKLIK